MATDLLLFQRFISREAAQDVAALLAEHGIAGQVVDEGSIADGITSFQNHPAALLLLPPRDFSKAREVMQRATEAQAATVESDHYLFEFTEVELRDVLAKPDEWSALDVALAQRILRERGQAVPAAAVRELAQKRTQALAKPQEMARSRLVLGYASAAAGGLLGVFFGMYLMTSQITLPDGVRVPMYTAYSRMHGRLMVVLGAAVFVAAVLQAMFGGRG